MRTETIATEATAYDSIIVGAGVAGVTCAVWLKRMGYSVLLLEATEQVGGMCARNPFMDEWNPTAPGLSGKEVAANLVHSLAAAEIEVQLQHQVQSVESTAEGFRLQVATPTQQQVYVRAKKLVVATGVDYKVPAECVGQSFDDVLIGAGARLNNYDFKAKRVAVLGGGDNALENAVFAQNRGAASVHVYARTLRGQSHWLTRLKAEQISVGDYDFDPQQKKVAQQFYDVVLVFYGYEPQAQWLKGLPIDLDDKGYIEVDFRTAQTAVPSLYAIGEVTRRQHPCVVTAMADGVTAAKAIQRALDLGV
ncbi:NAD(P)/FAD-dependent oxidoreductase [Oligella urethralis]|uniref:NAD(P)/FAD-dependent oxidoreductase n=1 Tax=Oligella urethralis TaxID=90245 RepID=UPI000DF87675|nr:NAD(P)/FAD-dependent oxidoreductase [Oligella urethralis]SUA59530.1 Thioredoxin reductase [Oligella urethralis]